MEYRVEQVREIKLHLTLSDHDVRQIAEENGVGSLHDPKRHSICSDSGKCAICYIINLCKREVAAK